MLCLTALTLVTPLPAVSQETETSPNESLLKEVRALRQRVAELELIEARLSRLEAMLLADMSAGEQHPVSDAIAVSAESPTDYEVALADQSIQERIQVSGVVEAEAGYLKDFSDEQASDIVGATVAIAIEANLSADTVAVVSFLYEEDDTPFEVDEAFISHASGNSTWTIGQIYLPFGTYETAMLNDPLTLEIAETRETALLWQYQRGGLGLEAYGFNGDTDIDGRDTIQN